MVAVAVGACVLVAGIVGVATDVMMVLMVVLMKCWRIRDHDGWRRSATEICGPNW